jgi:uncharacterized protein (TIGR03437 family)
MNPAAVSGDSFGNIFIADVNSNRIRQILPTGIIFTVAGNGNYVCQGDGGLATNAGLQSPSGVLAVGANRRGTVRVTVTNANVTATATTMIAEASPAFSLLRDGVHVDGIILRSDGSGTFGGGTYNVIGPAGNSLGYPTVPAKAGDNIVLYGTGFGPTNPLDTGPLSGQRVAVLSVDIRIDDISVRPTFAGLSSPGLFQLNLYLPSGLGRGDRPLAATVIGLSTQKNVVIALQ